MKKSLLVALFALLSVAAVVAQPRAIGVNLGSASGISYQHSLGNNMLDINVGVPLVTLGGLHAAVVYDWINPFGTSVPWNERGSWDWYMGVGAAGGVYGWNWDWAYVGAAGQIGIEYNFWFPMAISIDWRPTIGVELGAGSPNGKVGFGLYGLYNGAIGIRYRF